MSRRRREQPDVEWNFFAFPPAFMFALGGLLAILLAAFVGYGFMFLLSLFGTSFGVAHIIGQWVKRRSTDRMKQRAEEDERERRALAARQAAALTGEQASTTAKRRRRRTRRNNSDPAN